jgi:Domain of unknown function DUF29
MPDDLYDRDILIWSEQQADLLRRLSAGERVNEAVDWTNLIEEVEDVGRSQLQACESHLYQALVHLLKLSAVPHGPSGKWEGEVGEFLRGVRKHYAPSMRQRIDLNAEYRDALERVRRQYKKRAKNLPNHCPFTLDDLLSVNPDIDRLLQMLRSDEPAAARNA